MSLNSTRNQIVTVLTLALASPMSMACSSGSRNSGDKSAGHQSEYYTPMEQHPKTAPSHDDQIVRTGDNPVKRSEDQTNRNPDLVKRVADVMTARNPDVSPATIAAATQEVRRLRRLANRYQGTTCSGTGSAEGGSMSCVTPQGKSVSFKVLTADVAAKFTKAAKFIEQSPAGYAALPSAALPQSIATSYADYVAGNAGTIGTQSLEQSAFADTPAVAVDANRGPLRGSSGAGFRQPASAAK